MLRRQGDLPSSELPSSDSIPHYSPLWLLVWIVIQLAALSVAALQVPLSARSPEPAERLALHVMVVVQVSSAAMVFPVLMRSWGASVMVIAVSWPFVQLAGYLSGQPGWIIAVCALYLSIWLGVLAIWREMLRSVQGRMIGTTVAVMLSLGGAMLWYLRAEFSSIGAEMDWVEILVLGPVVGILSVVVEGGAMWRPWLFLIALSIVTGFVYTARRLRHLIH